VDDGGCGFHPRQVVARKYRSKQEMIWVGERYVVARLCTMGSIEIAVRQQLVQKWRPHSMALAKSSHQHGFLWMWLMPPENGGKSWRWHFFARIMAS